MTPTGTKHDSELVPQPILEDPIQAELPSGEPADAALRRLRLLWNRRRSLRRAALAGLLIGALLAFVLPKRFESTTRLMPPDNQSSAGMAMLMALGGRTGGALSGLSSLAGDLIGVKSTGALFIGVLRSRTVEDRLIDRFDLRKVYWVRLVETARKKLEQNTSISENQKSGIITIKVTDRDPQRAAAMAKAYVEELDRLVAQVSTSSARREREFLEQRLKAVQADLEDAEKEFSQFASKSGAIDIKEQGKAMVGAAATLEGQLIAAKSELEGLKQIYTDSNVRVRSAKARIAELQSQLEKVGGKGESGSAPSGAQEDRLYPSIRKLPLLGVTYADLYRRTKVQEAVFEALTQHYELAKLQEVKETPSVKVLDEARVPEKKSFPPRLLIIFLCGLLAVLGATIWVVVATGWEELDARDPRKMFAREVFQTLNAHMPWAPPHGSRVQSMTHRVWRRLAWRKESV